MHLLRGCMMLTMDYSRKRLRLKLVATHQAPSASISDLLPLQPVTVFFTLLAAAISQLRQQQPLLLASNVFAVLLVVSRAPTDKEFQLIALVQHPIRVYA